MQASVQVGRVHAGMHACTSLHAHRCIDTHSSCGLQCTMEAVVWGMRARCATVCMHACLYAGDNINFAAAPSGLLNVAAAASALPVTDADPGPGPGPGPAPAATVISKVVATSPSTLVITFAEEYTGGDAAAEACTVSDITVSNGHSLGTGPMCSALTAGALTWTITLGDNPTIAGGTPACLRMQTCQWQGHSPAYLPACVLGVQPAGQLRHACVPACLHAGAWQGPAQPPMRHAKPARSCMRRVHF